MKLSRYVISVDLDKEKSMLYSIKTRKYFSYKCGEKNNVHSLVENINKGAYSIQEIEYIKQLIKAGILIEDDADELKELEYLENKAKYQNGELQIMIVITNACNFRCKYCIQEHEDRNLTPEAEEKILHFIKNNAKSRKKIRISWFGGEPLLRFNDIERIIGKANIEAKKYGCQIISDFTTNGYLLNSEIIHKMTKMNIESIQITLDGDRKSHDSMRYLTDTSGTYDKVKSNLVDAVKRGLFIVLRINVSEENMVSASEVLSEIPEECRKNIAINVSNLYQAKDKFSTFDVYKKAIELGYQYVERNNTYIACHTCLSNGYVIDMDGNLIICANASEDRSLGKINAEGYAQITNKKTLHKIKTASMTKNSLCQNCIQLPLCIPSCKKSIYKENVRCRGKRANGLSVEDVAKLDYLHDRRCANA